MKLLITAAMLFYFVGDSRADDRSCKKSCREIYRSCVDKADEAAEDSYMNLEMLTYKISSDTLHKLYQHSEDSHKSAKALCRENQKSCVKTCNQD